ncbi:MAG: IclR family transcriptional regulator [Lacisediminihabitans sp.]
MQVQSVRRAFEVLEKMTDADGPVTASHLSSVADLPLPDVRRLLCTLSTLGYLVLLGRSGYVLGPRLVRLGEVANEQFGAQARPHLKTLVDKLGESANMAVLYFDAIVYVAHVSSPHAMRTSIEVGQRAYPHATGVGKAILAELPEDRVRTIVPRTGLAAPTQRSIRNLDDLLAEITKIRERGYSIDEGEQEAGVRCYAVAIPNSPTPAAISVSGPALRIGEGFAERALPVLRAVAASISSDLHLDWQEAKVRSI